MKPAYWIGILAILGAILGYAVNFLAGWADSAIGAVVGILAGTILYANLNEEGQAPIESHTFSTPR